MHINVPFTERVTTETTNVSMYTHVPSYLYSVTERKQLIGYK